MISFVSLILGAVLKDFASTHTQTSSSFLPSFLPSFHAAILFRVQKLKGCTQRKKQNGLHQKEEEEEERERNGEWMGGGGVGLVAPVSTTGILGLIIQMWMLLLENTRSRVEALSSTVDQKQSSVLGPNRYGIFVTDTDFIEENSQTTDMMADMMNFLAVDIFYVDCATFFTNMTMQMYSEGCFLQQITP